MSANRCILACVTPQLSCSKLIEVGKVLAKQHNANLEILCVFPQKACLNPDLEALCELQKVATDANAQMTIFFNDSPVFVISGYAVKKNTLTMLTGFPKEKSSRFVESFHSILPDIPISMVDDDGKVYRIVPAEDVELVATQTLE
ncbi:MAG: hypothetical protein K5756_03735 [Clostridiales bacterium]|nr:hypothetical protein [Clostridiales bacterium]